MKNIIKLFFIGLLLLSWVSVIISFLYSINVVLNCIAGVFYGAMIGFNLAYWEDNEDVS